jgi:hypothetical protein
MSRQKAGAKPFFLGLMLMAVLLAGCVATSFEGNYVVQAGQIHRGTIVATSGAVTLEEGSRVTGSVILTSGALMMGRDSRIDGDAVLTSGTVTMAEGSVIHGDLITSSSEVPINMAPGATVEGQVTTNIAPWAVSTGVIGLLLLCCLPLLVMVGLFLLLGIGVGRSSRRKPEVAATPASVAAPVASATGDAQQKLKQLKAMLDDGLISEADYESKKAEILAKM